MTGTRVPALGLAEATGHLEAVEVGQHDVEHDQVGAGLLDLGQRLAAGGGPLDLEAVVAETHGHQLGDVLLVVDDEHLGGWELALDMEPPTRAGTGDRQGVAAVRSPLRATVGGVMSRWTDGVRRTRPGRCPSCRPGWWWR